MGLALASVLWVPHHLHPLSMSQPSKMGKSLSASIIIPSLNRPESLIRVLESLAQQTFLDYEIIIRREEGPLAKIRNDGAREAKGDYLIFIDDDVCLTPYWLSSIVTSFQADENIGGVSGPAVITNAYRRNRDLFAYPRLKKLYDIAFLEGKGDLPGQITKSGTWTTGASNETCTFEGKVDYLEACNMAFKADVFWKAGGFDESYGGIGDWSEPDLAFRVRQLGYVLWFNPLAKLYHEPSRTGAYLKRDTCQARLSNYLLFSRRWIKPSWRHELYKSFLRTYYFIKRQGWLR